MSLLSLTHVGHLLLLSRSLIILGGGCVIDHPWASSLNPSPHGQNCNKLIHEHALTFTCQASRCVVSSCQDGYVPSGRQDKCINKRDIDATSITTLFSSALNVAVKVRAAIFACGNNDTLSILLGLSAQLGSTSLQAIHRPGLCDDLLNIATEIDVATHTALSLQGLSSSSLVALENVATSNDDLIATLLNLSALLGRCQCHDSQDLLQAINTLIVGDPSFSYLTFQLSSSQYVTTVTTDSTDLHLLDSNSDSSSVVAIDGNPKMIASLTSFGRVYKLAIELHLDSYAWASSTDSSSNAQCPTKLLQASENILVDLGAQPLCFDDAVERSKELLAVTEDCLALSDLAANAELKTLLVGLHRTSLQLWIASENASDDLHKCGCQNEDQFVRGTKSILASYTLGVKTRSVTSRRIRRRMHTLSRATTSLKSDITSNVDMGVSLGLSSDLNVDASASLNSVLVLTSDVVGIYINLDTSLKSLVNLAASPSSSDLLTCTSNALELVANPPSYSPTCWDTYLDLTQELLNALDPCLGLDLAEDTNNLLQSTVALAYQAISATNALLEDLRRCGCNDDADLIQATKKIFSGLGVKRGDAVDTTSPDNGDNDSTTTAGSSEVDDGSALSIDFSSDVDSTATLRTSIGFGSPLAVDLNPTSPDADSSTTLAISLGLSLNSSIQIILERTAELIGYHHVLYSSLESLVNSTCNNGALSTSPLNVCLSNALAPFNDIQLSSLTDVSSLVSLTEHILKAITPCADIDLDASLNDLVQDSINATTALFITSGDLLDLLHQCGCEQNPEVLAGTSRIMSEVSRRDVGLDVCVGLDSSGLDIYGSDISLTGLLGNLGDSTLSNILNETYSLLGLRSILNSNSQSVTDSCNCSSASDPLSSCVSRLGDLTFAIARLVKPSDFYSLPPLLNQLDSVLHLCLGLGGANSTRLGLDGLLDTTDNLLTATENLLNLYSTCGCQHNHNLIVATRKLAASQKHMLTPLR